MKIKIVGKTAKGLSAVAKMKKDYDWKAKLVMKAEFVDDGSTVIIKPIFKNGFGSVVGQLPVEELQKESEKRWEKTMRDYGCSIKDYSLEVLK